jgi:hypothetical protein
MQSEWEPGGLQQLKLILSGGCARALELETEYPAAVEG